MDEASVALKLEGTGHGLVAVGGAGVAAGMRIASTCIEVPRVRLHSMRQWRKSRRGLGRQAAMGCHFRDLHEGIVARDTGDEEESGPARSVDAATVAGCIPAKSADSISPISTSMMPALQQIGGIEFLLLAA
jgi:hypothetical protein